MNAVAVALVVVVDLLGTAMLGVALFFVAYRRGQVEGFRRGVEIGKTVGRDEYIKRMIRSATVQSQVRSKTSPPVTCSTGKR